MKTRQPLFTRRGTLDVLNEERHRLLECIAAEEREVKMLERERVAMRRAIEIVGDPDA